MAENLDIGITAQAWADIVVEKWENNVMRLKIRKTGDLIDSFHGTAIREANGNPYLIEFLFNYYGKFVDMGVGRGVKLGEQIRSKRVAKDWYSSTFFNQLQILGDLLGRKYSEKGKMVIIENLAD